MSDSAKIVKPRPVHMRVIKEMQPVQKTETSTQIEMQEAFNGSEWIQHPMDLHVLERYVSESSILPQCIHAYRNNIPGFGIGVRYVEDIEETPEMEAEFNSAKEIIELLTIEQDTKEIFEDIIEARETYGIAYVEVIRNLANEVVQIEFIRNTPSIMKTEPLEPYVPFTYYHHGTSLVRQRKFRKYRQDIGGKTVYYKEFGDPRIMDRRNGKYLEAGETLDRKWQANEILEFAIGTKDNMIARLEKELSTVQSKKTKAIEALAKLRLEKQKIAGESSGNDAVLLWAEKIKEKRKENSNV